MVLINPKILLVAVVFIGALLLIQLVENTAQKSTDGFKRNLISGTIESVDSDICDQIKVVFKSKEPCRWVLDKAFNTAKIMVGSKLIAEIQYSRWRWDQMYSEVQNAIVSKFPSLEGQPLVTAYVKVEQSFEGRGIGSYVLSTIDRLLESGTIRVVLDDDFGWVKLGESIPNNATPLLHGIWLFRVGQ